MIKVVDGIYRGPRPLSLQDIPGIKTVLSLESGWFEVFHDEIYAEDQMEASGNVRIFHVPMNSVGLPPSNSSLEKAYDLMTNFALHPIYVHCKQGVDRTGLLVAYFRIRNQKWSFKKAIKEMINRGFHKYRYCLWIPWLWFIEMVMPVDSRYHF